MNFQTMSKQRKFILIAAAVGIISIFLPWITISAGIFGSQSINGFHGIGLVVFLAFAGAIVLSLIGDQTKTLDNTMWMLSLIAGGLALLAVAISFINGRSGGFGLIDAGYGIGIWLSLLAAIAVLGSAWMFKSPSDSLKDGFESIKKSMATPPATSVSPSAATTVSTPPPTPNNVSNAGSKIAELEKLVEMRNQGHISEEEYQQLKSKLL